MHLGVGLKNIKGRLGKGEWFGRLEKDCYLCPLKSE